MSFATKSCFHDALAQKHVLGGFIREGYPSQRFLTLVKEVVPDQCTLVPDEPGQLTSDHGWDIAANRSLLLDVNTMLREKNIRSSLFLDPIPDQVNEADEVGSNRIEFGSRTPEEANERGRRTN